MTLRAHHRLAALLMLTLAWGAFFLLVRTPEHSSAQNAGCSFDNATLTRYADAVPSSSVGALNLAEALRCFVNYERTKAGLPVLPSNATLRNLAVGYSADMVKNKYFSHNSPGGSTVQSRATAAKYTAISGRQYYIGENLAWGAGSYGTPRSIITGWMNSAPHRANVLFTGFREIGIGMTLGAPVSPAPASPGTYVAEFGAR